jgi:hypothetical protein
MPPIGPIPEVPAPFVYVGYWGKTGRHLLAMSSSQFEAAQAFRSAKLNYCTPFRWSQFLLNPQDARDSAS